MLICLLSFFLVYFEFGIGILNRLRFYKHIAVFSAVNILFQRGLQIILGLTVEDKVLAIFISYCLSNLILILSMFLIIHRKINLISNMNFNPNILRNFFNHIFYRVIYTLSNLLKTGY